MTPRERDMIAQIKAEIELIKSDLMITESQRRELLEQCNIEKTAIMRHAIWRAARSDEQVIW